MPKINKYRRCFSNFCVLIILMFSSTSSHPNATPSEQELRAAVIVGVLRFTTWPSDAKQTTVDICLAGSPLSADPLLNLDHDQKIKGANVIVRKVFTVEDVVGCKALILGKNLKRTTISDLMAYAQPKPIVTLCDDCYRSRIPNATIYLSLHKQSIQFEVDWITAKKNGVLFDSSLLELALNQRHQ